MLIFCCLNLQDLFVLIYSPLFYIMKSYPPLERLVLITQSRRNRTSLKEILIILVG